MILERFWEPSWAQVEPKIDQTLPLESFTFLINLLIEFWSDLHGSWAKPGRQEGFLSFLGILFERVLVPLGAKLAPKAPPLSPRRPQELQEAPRGATDRLQDGFWEHFR